MKIAPVAEVKARFSAYLKASEEGLVIITRNGKPVAALVPVRDEAELERLVLAYSSQFQHILQVAKQQIREGRGIDHEDMWREVEVETQEEAT